MSDFRLDAEALFLDHLSWINRTASFVCDKHGIWGDEAEDFASWLRMKLIEDDYAVVRKFRGDSSLTTYLVSVMARYFVSYVRMHRGEWRPSTAARRLGAPAGDLERLVLRDGYTVQQAGELLRTAGRTALTDAELARLLPDLPLRNPLRPVELHQDGVLDAAAGGSRADDLVIAAEAETQRVEVMKALHRALEQLEPEDRLIVRMHFADGRTLAEIARGLSLEQKPLYRRVDRLRTRLRALLGSAGLRADDVRAVLHEPESA